MKSRLLFLLFFTLLSMVGTSQFTSIGLIGSGLTGDDTGWSMDRPMTKLTDSTWTLDIKLFNGKVKFRADQSWDINWGSAGFPSGIGTQGGADITVIAGDYTVTFNSNSGAYLFDVDSDISLIGSATTGDDTGWGFDTKLFRNQEDTNKYFRTLTLFIGKIKFRTTGSWDVNWGSEDFPSGIGTQGGSDIPIDVAGKYAVSFDKSTGAYSFDEVIDFTSIGIIGSATEGGWDAETAMLKSASNPDLWSITLTLKDGEAKFRANNSWDINWGGTDFPDGIGVPGSSDNIPVTAGEYIISFNTNTLVYRFIKVVEYETVGIIGDATPGGWDADTPMEKDSENKSLWRLRIVLKNGAMKFRANNNWDTSWGGSDFPSGVAEGGFSPDIPITAGEYKITFNSATLEYNFEEVIEFGTISLVGKNGPFGDWPGDDDSRDAYLTKDTDDGNLWTLANVTLTSYDAVTDGGIKFRAEAAWTINWGAADFPSGVGTQNGPNIRPVAGTYSVVFRSDTGEYTFGSPSSTVEVLNPSNIKIFPNPAKDILNIEFGSNEFNGQSKVIIYDIKGNQVMAVNMQVDQLNTLNISNLQSGNYILNIQNEKYIVSKKLNVIK